MKIFALVIILFINLSAEECSFSYSDFLNKSFSKKQKYNKQMINPLSSLGKCGWISEATSLIVTVILSKDDEFYAKTDRESFESKGKSNLWFKELHEKINKTITSELYFANLTYIDLNIVQNIMKDNEYNKEYKQKHFTTKPLEVNVNLSLEKYNETSDLYYGKLAITFKPFYDT